MQILEGVTVGFTTFLIEDCDSHRITFLQWGMSEL
jgi:hypothetical protein